MLLLKDKPRCGMHERGWVHAASWAIRTFQDHDALRDHGPSLSCQLSPHKKSIIPDPTQTHTLPNDPSLLKHPPIDIHAPYRPDILGLPINSPFAHFSPAPSFSPPPSPCSIPPLRTGNTHPDHPKDTASLYHFGLRCTLVIQTLFPNLATKIIRSM